jgi:hypothetical protein
MAKSCVSLSSPEFKNLLEETGKDMLELAAEVSRWQDANGVENFPNRAQLEDYFYEELPRDIISKSVLENMGFPTGSRTSLAIASARKAQQEGKFNNLEEGINWVQENLVKTKKEDNLYYQNRINARTRAKKKLIKLGIIDKYNNIIEGQLGEFRRKGREWSNYYIQKGVLKQGEQLIVDERGSKAFFNEDFFKRVDQANFQLEKQSGLAPNEDLNLKLEAWAEKHGISIVAMETLKKRLEGSGRYVDGAIGVADITNQLIGIAQKQADITTLPEEVAHFAIELLLEDISVQRALLAVTETQTYADVKEQYKDIYTTEEQFRKEALGKVLAEEIINKNKEDVSNKGVRGYLNGIKQKFSRWINKIFGNQTTRDELKEILAPIASTILKGEYLGDVNSLEGDPFYSLEEESDKIIDVDAKVAEIMQNAEFIKLSDSQGNIVDASEATHYINTRTGEVYERVTSYIKGPVSESSLLDTANLLGNKADEFVRDFFSGAMKDLSEYDLAPNVELQKFLESLSILKAQFTANGEKVIANGITLYDANLGIAGTVDLLTYDNKGNFRIYDMKTMRGNQLKTTYKGDPRNVKYDSTLYGQSNRESHMRQLSLYRILLNNTHGVKAKELGVVPIVFPKYQAGTTSVSSVNIPRNGNVVSIIGHKALDKVEDAELDLEETIEDFDAEFIENPLDISENEMKLKFLNDAISSLKSRRKALQTKGKKQKSKELTKEIFKIEKKIALGELDAGIQGLLLLAKSETDSIRETLNGYRKQGAFADTSILKMSKDFLDMYDGLFTSLLAEMNMWIPSTDTMELQTEVEDFRADIQKIRDINLGLIRRNVVSKLDSENRNAFGEVIDPTFDAKDIYRETEADASWWRVLTGSYANSSSNILKIAMKMIKRGINSVKRFTIETGRDLIILKDEFNKAGFKQEDLVEVNNEGKKGAFIVSEYNRHRFQEDLDAVRAEVASKLGFESFEEIIVTSLSKKEADYYTRAIKNFYTENTQKIGVEEETVGGQKLIIQKIVPAQKYYNKEFAKNMENEAFANYYNLLLETKKEALAKLPTNYQNENAVYLLPQIRRTFMERLGNKNQSFLKNMLQIGEDSFLLDADDTQFGDLSNIKAKTVPIFFNNRMRTDSDISYDLANTYTHYAEMAENFKSMNKLAPDLENILTTVGERTYIKGKFKKEKKEGKESNEYRALEGMLDFLVYGKEREVNASGVIGDSWLAKKLGVNGKRVSWTKVSQKFAGYIRTNNLAFNLVTSTAGLVKGSIDSHIEDMVGIYTTPESKLWARGELLKNLSAVMAQIGNPKQTNKMHLILEQNDIVDLGRSLKDSEKNRITRKIVNKDFFFTNYMMADYVMKGNITLAVYDNYRLVGDRFVTKQQFVNTKREENSEIDNKTIDAEWKELRSKNLYSAFEMVNDKLVIKEEYKNIVTEDVLDIVKNRITQIAAQVDGVISPEDKGALARTILGDFVLMHRGWFLSGIDNRFKKSGMNYQTEEHEVGYYRAFGSFIKKFLAEEGPGLQARFASWDKLSAAEKRGVKKTVLDLVYMQALAIIAAMIGKAADDDPDDFTLNFAAYQMNRILLEQKAFITPKELIEIMDEPVVGARTVRELMSISDALNFSETYEKGMYKGQSHASRWWQRRFPTRNLYELQFPKQKNRFIKSILDSPTYNFYAKDDMDLGSFLGITSFSNIFADENASDGSPNRSYSDSELELLLDLNSEDE